MTSGRRFIGISPKFWVVYSTPSSVDCRTAVDPAPRLPRMADFAAFGEAVCQTLQWPAGMFLHDYEDNRREATMTQLEDSIVGTVLLKLLPRHREGLELHALQTAINACSWPGPGGDQVVKLAQVAREAYKRAAPHCSSTPHARLICHDLPKSSGASHFDNERRRTAK